MEVISWVGAMLLSICAVPLAWDAVRHKRAEVNVPFLALWFTGEVLMLVYSLSLGDAALVFNYGANTLLLLPVVAVKWRNR